MGEFVQDALVLKSTSKECGNNGHVYNVQVNTPDNGDEWFGCGFEDPKLNVGDEIEFEIETVGKYTNLILDTLVVTKAAPQREQSSRGRSNSSRGDSRGSSRGNSRDSGRGNQSSRGNSRGSRDSGSSNSRGQSQSRGRSSAAEKAPAVDWARKDNLIRLQSCQNTAINTINMMFLAGFIAVPKAKADRYDALQALIEDEAQRLYFKYEDIVDGKYGDGGDDQGQDQDEYPDDVPS